MRRRKGCVIRTIALGKDALTLSDPHRQCNPNHRIGLPTWERSHNGCHICPRRYIATSSNNSVTKAAIGERSDRFSVT